MQYKHETHSDDEGRVIFAKVPHSTFESPLFCGEGFYPPEEPEIRFEFDIPGENIDHAFANWQEVHDAKLAIVKAEYEKDKAAAKRKNAAPKIQRATADMVPKMASRRG